MRNVFLYTIVFIFFTLSCWQIIRFRNKHEEFVFFEKRNISINDVSNISVDGEYGYLYFWQGKIFDLNPANNEIYRTLKDMLDGNQTAHNNILGEISEKNLYYKNTICGDYIKDKGFVIYRPTKKENENLKNNYSLIVPLIFKEEIILVKYGSFSNKEKAESELKELNDSDKTMTFPEIFKTTNKVAICFNGILTDAKYYLASNMSSFFVKNDINNNYWVNLNESDLNEYLKDQNKKTPEFLLDNTIDNLDQFKRMYKHHIFYALMWFSLGVFVIYFIYKKEE